MVALVKNSDRPNQPATDARFNRRTPRSNRFENQNLSQRYKRARIYSAQLGRFASRDPLGFVDGMSLYRAYFVPNYVDPNGKDTKRDPAGARTGTVCAVILQDHGMNFGGGHPVTKEANSAADHVLNPATSKAEILEFLKKNGCCTLYVLGHRGGAKNPGGVTIYPLPPKKPETLFPDADFEGQLKDAFSGCDKCAINLAACGDLDPKGNDVRDDIANNTGCNVCGSTKSIEFGTDTTLGEDDGDLERWKPKCSLPPGGGSWNPGGGECIRWGLRPAILDGDIPCPTITWVCLERAW